MHHYWVTLLYSCNGPLGLQTGCMFKCHQFNIEHVYFFVLPFSESFCSCCHFANPILAKVVQTFLQHGVVQNMWSRVFKLWLKQAVQWLVVLKGHIFIALKSYTCGQSALLQSSISAFLLPVRGISARRTQKSVYTQRMPQRTNNRHTFFHLIRKWTRERRKWTTQAVLPSASCSFQVYSQIMPSTCQDCCFDSACSMFHACSYNYKSSEDDRSLDDARNCGSLNVTIVEWNRYSYNSGSIYF